MKSEYIQIIALIIVVTLYTLFVQTLEDIKEQTYTKDNQIRATKIRETLPKMVSPIEIQEYFSSTHGGKTRIKFVVKHNPNNQKIDFSLCKNNEFLYDSTRYDGEIILIWEYPQKQCQ